MMKVEFYNNGQFWYRVEVWGFCSMADGRSRGVDPLAVAGPVTGGSIGPFWGDAPMGGILGLLLGLAPWARVQHRGQGSSTTGRCPAQHPGLFPLSLHIFRLLVQELLARRIPGWVCLGSQPGRSGVSSVTNGLGCPVLVPVVPRATAGLGWMSLRAAKKSGIWENLRATGEKGLWEGVTCPQKVLGPVILTRGLVAVLGTPGRPRKDGGFGICCRPLLCRQPGDGQGIVIPECWSAFLQQSRGRFLVPGSRAGMCKVLRVFLPLFTAQIPGRDRARGLV